MLETASARRSLQSALRRAAPNKRKRLKTGPPSNETLTAKARKWGQIQKHLRLRGTRCRSSGWEKIQQAIEGIEIYDSENKSLFKIYTDRYM